MNFNFEDVHHLYTELKDRYPSLTMGEALTAALDLQQNAILEKILLPDKSAIEKPKKGITITIHERKPYTNELEPLEYHAETVTEAVSYLLDSRITKPK